ncbi:MAG: ribonuclease catalytic domain-containing protein [Candidatus Dadabacteria bacterium]|nr:ribonuclease catalytic domain-containing protein [Candidatus Dadabacteria bacterium]
MTRSRFPSPHEVVLFRKRKEPSLGIFIRALGDKLTLFSEEGREVDVDPDKVAFISGVRIEGEFTASEKKLKLRDLRRDLDEEKQGIDLVTIWQCYEGSEDEVPFDELLSLYFGEKGASDRERIALFWAVDKDDIYFRRGEGGYAPRTPEEAGEIIKKKETEEKKKEDLEKALYWAKGVLMGNPPSNGALNEVSGYVDLLRGYVTYLDKFSRSPEAKSFLSEIGIRDVEGALEFLIKAGAWREDEDPILKRFSIRDDFPDGVEIESDRLIGEGLPGEGFEDLTGLDIFSIDDENTEDIDDALSIRQTDGGTEVGIHISNVAALVPKWSDADEEAGRRGETIYLPEKRIHMFPLRLVKERLSLVEGRERLSLSLFVTFDGENNIKGQRFTNSLIKVRKNMSYTEGSEFFQTDPGGIRMREIALRLRNKRLEAGALIVQLPQLKIRINGDGRIRVEKNYMNSVAHVVVAEMMILMNRMSGRFLRENKIPGIYRSQPEPVPDDVRALDESSPLYPVRVVKFLRAPRVGLNPEPHMSLGIDVYTQVTSPIRRYPDIIMQRQIVSELLYGEAAYSEEEIENLYPRIEVGIRDKKTIERQRERYWLYKHLRSLEGGEIEGIISSVTDTRASAYLPDYLFETPVSLGSERIPEEGTSVRLRVRKVDPLRKILSLATV